MLKSQLTVLDMPLQGMTQLSSILDIVKNERVYAKRLKGLEAQQDKLIELIETVGKVESIDLLKKQVKEETKKLEAELDTITAKQEKADSVIEEAKIRVRSMEADVSSRARDQKSVLDLREKELLANRAQLNARDIELRKAEERIRGSQLAVDAEISRLKQLQESANKARIDYEERRQKIETALAGA